jgi:YVTN family beta-propeller protein
MDKRKSILFNTVTFLVVFSLLIFIQVFTINNAFADGPKIYVGNSRDNTVSVIDSSTNEVHKTISVPNNPEGMVISLNDRVVYVGSTSTSTVSLIDTRSDAVNFAIEVGGNSQGLAISPDGSEVLVAIPDNDQFAIIDTARNKVAGKIPLPEVAAITVDRAGEYAFATSQNMKHYSLNEFTIATNAMLFPIPIPYAARQLSFSPDGKFIYFTVVGQDTLAVINIFEKKLVAEIPIGKSPFYVTFSHDGKTGLVVSQGDNLLVLFDPKTNTVISKIKVGKSPYWIAINASDTKAYVTNEGSDDVSVVDLASKKVIETISVGDAPHQIVMQRVSLQ